MKRLKYTLLWFLGLALVVKLLFLNQGLGFFWLAIAGLSMFFGFQTCSKIELTDNMSYQLTTWITTYQELSYYKQQLYLNEVVNGAVKSGQVKEALEFIECILQADPDNETAKSLMVSIWGADFIDKYS